MRKILIILVVMNLVSCASVKCDFSNIASKTPCKVENGLINTTVKVTKNFNRVIVKNNNDKIKFKVKTINYEYNKTSIKGVHKKIQYQLINFTDINMILLIKGENIVLYF
jgi:hypothetical protein